MLKLTILTPERRLLVTQEVEEVTVPGFRGELNILEGHAPLITTLETGVLRWKLKGKDRQDLAAISWGYCQVNAQGVNVLGAIVDTPEEIDLPSAKEKLANAEKKIMNEVTSEEEISALTKEIAHSRVKIELAEKIIK